MAQGLSRAAFLPWMAYFWGSDRGLICCGGTVLRVRAVHAGIVVATFGYDGCMKIVGIISDTHGRLDERAYAALADCDHIIHAGDIGGPEILRELETLAPVTAVLGNNDFSEYGSAVGRFARPSIEGVRFLVAHYPQDVRVTALGNSALAPGDPLPHVLVHGHTHVPKLETGAQARPADVLLCPGSAFRPRSGSPRCVARMELEDGRVLSARIESLDGDVLLSFGR